MKNEYLHRSMLLLALGGTTILASSCASAAAQKAAKEQDYIEVYDTGSNIPRRIPKTKKAPDASTASDTQMVSPDALNAVDERSMAKTPPSLGK